MPVHAGIRFLATPLSIWVHHEGGVEAKVQRSRPNRGPYLGTRPRRELDAGQSHCDGVESAGFLLRLYSAWSSYRVVSAPSSLMRRFVRSSSRQNASGGDTQSPENHPNTNRARFCLVRHQRNDIVIGPLDRGPSIEASRMNLGGNGACALTPSRRNAPAT